MSIALTFCTLSLLAQNVSRLKKVEQFYTDYFTLWAAYDARVDSLVMSNCTPEFVKAWQYDVREKGLYDPLTNGCCDDFNMMRRSLRIQEKDGSYIVSFNYLAWPTEDICTESVIVFLNAEGKISHTKRPSDGYMTPDL